MQIYNYYVIVTSLRRLKYNIFVTCSYKVRNGMKFLDNLKENSVPSGIDFATLGGG